MNIIVGISGASGVIMGRHLLSALKGFPEVKTHLIITEEAEINFELERAGAVTEAKALADCIYDNADFAAPVASGSFEAAGMIVIPCSMKTVAGIACGYSENLLLRAADVTLKESRPLVLAPREMPFSKLHLRNLWTAADCGATIIVPALTFYNGADTVEKQIDHVVGKILQRFGLKYERFRPWEKAG